MAVPVVRSPVKSSSSSRRSTTTTSIIFSWIGKALFVCAIIWGILLMNNGGSYDQIQQQLLIITQQQQQEQEQQEQEPKVERTQEELNALLLQHKSSLQYFGNPQTNTGWKVDTLCLQKHNNNDNNNELIVYGVGCGEDISWDTAMVTKFDAKVFLFDPTEKSIAHVTPIVQQMATSHPNKLFFTSQGLSNQPGNLTFALPANPDHVSMRITDLAASDMTRTVTAQVNTLKAFMESNHHEYLDILKMDIEGSEYDVLESLMADNFLPFTQLLVEYHDRFLSPKQRNRHAALLQALREKAGFVELWSANGGQEVGYIKVADLDYCAAKTSTRHVGA